MDVRLTEHVDAFNAHDTPRLLAGFAEDAVWTTGQDVFRGRAVLAGLFDAGLWALNPSLRIDTAVSDQTCAAAELSEELTIDGDVHRFPIAVFLRFAGGLITRGTVYREGTADLP